MNRCLWPSIVLLSVLAVPVFAHADCPVPDTGIPEDAALHIDVAGMRKALAESGIGIGGFYAAETFGNPSSGFKQGATYDGVLELHLDGDLKKWGLWKGLCLHANGYQIHGRSITTHRKAIVVGVENFGDDDGAVCSGIGGPAAVPAARSRFRCRPLRSIACSSRVGVNLMNPVTSH